MMLTFTWYQDECPLVTALVISIELNRQHRLLGYNRRVEEIKGFQNYALDISFRFYDACHRFAM